MSLAELSLGCLDFEPAAPGLPRDFFALGLSGAVCAAILWPRVVTA
jgi:hypothetical protein